LSPDSVAMAAPDSVKSTGAEGAAIGFFDGLRSLGFIGIVRYSLWLYSKGCNDLALGHHGHGAGGAANNNRGNVIDRKAGVRNGDDAHRHG